MYRRGWVEALRNKVNEKEEVYGGLREEIGTKTYLRGPMDLAKTLKIRFRVGYLDLTKRKRYTSSQEEEEGAQRCPCGEAIE